MDEQFPRQKNMDKIAANLYSAMNEKQLRVDDDDKNFFIPNNDVPHVKIQNQYLKIVKFDHFLNDY